MTTLESINHDAGGVLTDYWDTVTDAGGRGSITVAAALNNSVEGCQVDYDASNNFSLSQNFASPASEELRLRAYFDPNGVSTPTVDNHTIFRMELGPSAFGLGDRAGQILVTKRKDGILRVNYSVCDDSSTCVTSPVETDITDVPHCFEIAVKRATSAVAFDGIVRFYIDGELKDSDTTVDNYDLFPTIDEAFFRSDSLEAAMAGDIFYIDEMILTDDLDTSLCADLLTLATMTKPMAIDASDQNIYLALLNNGTPVLLKMLSNLSADASLVFNPGAGDNIGVECSRFNADIVWVGGNFGTDKLSKSIDGGTTFTAKDDGTFADIEAFVVGPDTDDRVLVADETIEIQETVNSGDTWTQINASVGFNINAMARLGINVQECIFGNDADPSNAITYSPNSGDDMEDFTTGDFPTDADVTGVIVNG